MEALAGDRCDECKREALESVLNPGVWFLVHNYRCSNDVRNRGIRRTSNPRGR